MIVHRFMSNEEFAKLTRGEVLRNDSKHEGWRTTSVGFCFFTEPPSEAVHWLSGVCDTDICVTMDVPAEMLTQSRDTYGDVKKRDLRRITADGPEIERIEWCCREYSLETVKILEWTQKYDFYSDIKRELIRFGLLKK